MTRRTTFALLAVLAVTCLGTLLGCSRSPDLKRLTVDEVATRIAAKDGKTFVFDNNPKERFDEGHVPGAHWVQYDAVTAADLPTDKGATLIFYCASEL
jgi:hypothetical protein